MVNVPDDASSSTHTIRGIGPLPAGLRCPECRVATNWDEGRGRCPTCRRSFSLWGCRVYDFLGEASQGTEAVLDWPDESLLRIERGLQNLQAGRSLSSDDRTELKDRGLIGDHGRLSESGLKIAYHLAEHHRQAADDFIAPEILDRAGLDSNAHVLDVGCGAGQSLHQLASRRPTERVGVDFDLLPLALGCRLAEVAREEIWFVRASGHALPFTDGRFTHVMSRVALNYMHQRLALSEMSRVLQPGGTLYCRVEGPGQDLLQLSKGRGARITLRYLRDLALGLVHELTGRQAELNCRYTGCRVFATARRIGRNLRRSGCEIVSVTVIEPYARLPRNVEILARKRAIGSH